MLARRLRIARPSHGSRAACIMLLGAIKVLDLAASEAPTVIATTDGAGITVPRCQTCPNTRFSNDLPRRLTVVRSIQASDPDTIIVDAGGSLLGADAATAGNTVAGLNAIGYHALNLGYRDFRHGVEVTKELIQQSPVSVISANLQHNGQHIGNPHTLVPTAHGTVFLTGVSEQPVALSAMPDLRQQLESVTFIDPVLAVREQLETPEARAAAIRIVCWYGSARGWRSLRQAHGETVDIWVLGGDRRMQGSSRPLPPGVIVPPSADTGFGILPSGQAAAVQRTVSTEVVPDAVLEDQLNAARGAVEAVAPPPSMLDSQPMIPSTQEVRITGRNRGLSITATNVAYETTSDPSLTDIVLTLEIENRVPIDAVLDLGQPSATQIAGLSSRLVLITESGHLARRHEKGAPGSLRETVRLNRPGATASGTVKYRLPTSDLAGGLELHLAHERWGPAVVTLRPGGVPNPLPAESPGHNDLALIVGNVERLPAPQELGLEAGSELLRVELIGTSRAQREVPARAIDRDAAIRPKTRVGMPFEYLKDEQTLVLIVDGDRLCRRVYDQTATPNLPTFFPTSATRHNLTFAVPPGAQGLKLTAGFATYQGTSEGTVDYPSITLPFGPEPQDVSAPAPTEPLRSITDQPFTVTIHTVYREEGRIVIDAGLEHIGGPHGGLDLDRRFKFTVPSRNGQLRFESELTARFADGMPALPIFMRPGDRRRVRLAFADPGDATATLTYTGITTNIDIPLTFDQDGNARVGTAAATPVESAPDGTDSVAAPAGQGGQDAEVATEPELSLEERLRAALGRDLEPVGIHGHGMTGVEINEAIRRGREWLWNWLQANVDISLTRGGWITHSDLVLLALVKSDGQTHFPELSQYLSHYLANVRNRNTYSLSIYIMIAQAAGAIGKPYIGMALQSLINGQEPYGAWGYTSSPFQELTGSENQGPMLQVESGSRVGGGTVVPKTVTRNPDLYTVRMDTSVMQYAVLALRCAHLAGYEIEQEHWLQVRDILLHFQSEKDGGWGYGSGLWPRGSMTAAGVSSLVIANYYLGHEDPLLDESVIRGLEWLRDNYNPGINPRHRAWHYYWMYSYERVGRIIGSQFYGTNEWYPLGAQVLVGKQLEDGSWKGTGEERHHEIPTSFALLFLVQATEKLLQDPHEERLVITADTPAVLSTSITTPPPPGLLYLILDCSGSMRAKADDGISRFDHALAAVEAMIAGLPDGSRLAIRAFGHRHRANRREANTDSELIVPPGEIDREALRTILSELRARGKTPLGHSLTETLTDLRRVRGPVSIIVLTDGADDVRSGPDPIAAGIALSDRNNTKLRVVGLSIERSASIEQLKELTAGGRFTQLDELTQLTEQLPAVILGIPSPYQLFDDDGAEVVSGEWGDSHPLPPGMYQLRSSFAEQPLVIDVELEPGGKATVHFNPNGEPPEASTGTEEGDDTAERPDRPEAPLLCPNCQSRVSPDAAFCNVCGHPLK